MRGGLKNRAGSLLLYPDQLVHVGSKAAQIGGGFGLIGVLVTRGIANAQAPKKVAAGDKSVVSIPLASVSEVYGRNGKLGSKSLVVVTTTGDEFRFGGVNFEKWSEDLTNALTSIGRQVTPIDGRLTVR
jgi:hypothetical protein